jgi:membrane-associated phospholipid phosphatase
MKQATATPAVRRLIAAAACALACTATLPAALAAQVSPAATEPALLLLSAPTLDQRAPAGHLQQSGRDGEPFFTRADAYLALGFVAGTIAMLPLDRKLADELQDSTLQAHAVLRDLAGTLRFLGFPGSAIIGSSMYVVGRVGDMPRVAAIGLHGTEAVVLANGFVFFGKNFLGRARPEYSPEDPRNFGFMRGFRGSEYRSFPSGHTAAAFAVASAVTAETREIWPEATPFAGPVLYTGAALVGASRMYHNRHWASDVVMGAALGTFSGLKVIRYHYRYPENVVDRLLLSAAVVPTHDNGIMLVLRLPAR